MIPNDNKIMVSICCLTYNHENYIKDALDSFLMQQTNFVFEVLIHDDASTDNTAKIIEQYKKLYPEIIKPIIQTENQRSKLGGGMNPRFNYPRAQGKYIALCEGDDYWTDPLKLQRQVEFLENNQEYILCAENSEWHKIEANKSRPFSNLPERDIEITELLESRKFATASVVFRNIPQLNDFLKMPVSGDTIQWCYLTKFGKVKYFDIVSSVYRRHSGGVTATNSFKWAKQMMLWNKTIKQNHSDINNQIFNERNFDNFSIAATRSFHSRKLNYFIQSLYYCIKFKPLSGVSLIFVYLKNMFSFLIKKLFGKQ